MALLFLTLIIIIQSVLPIFDLTGDEYLGLSLLNTASESADVTVAVNRSEGMDAVVGVISLPPRGRAGSSPEGDPRSRGRSRVRLDRDRLEPDGTRGLSSDRRIRFSPYCGSGRHAGVGRRGDRDPRRQPARTGAGVTGALAA